VPSDAALIDVRGVTFGIPKREQPLVLDVSFFVRPGECWGIAGPNGAGKSTLAALLLHTLAPTSGSVNLAGQPIAAMPRRDIARRVALLPQREPIPQGWILDEFILMGRLARANAFTFDWEPADRDAASRAIDRVGLSDRRAQPLGSLSGGERQLALLARIIAQDTPLMILDEPATALDVRHAQLLERILEEELRAGRGLVIIGHDLSMLQRVATHVLLLRDGHVVAQGPIAETISPSVLESVWDVPFRMWRSDDGQEYLGPRAPGELS